MKIETKRDRMVMFSAISLTDIVLLLLIFFLLTSSYVVQPGIKVQLPKAASGVQAEADRVFLTITGDEQIFLNQQPVNQSEIGEKLRSIVSENPDILVVIRAEKDLSLEKTIQVVDIAKLAGVERFMIATQKGL